MYMIFYLLLAIIGGTCIGLQAGINGVLGKRIGVIEASFVSFFIGTIILLLLVIFAGKGDLLKVTNVPKWQLLGGALGVAYVSIMVAIVPKIGVASAITAVIVGQLFISVTLDHFGIFTNQRIPIDWYRISGLALLLVSLFLIFKGNIKWF
ncbi:DMT family transporter [Neobacillus sp. DY30]|uniref:DMT family transporter n=1 Tax=Neobacillus sp. DY30 TaxID=3047871 RepID=UPI0024BF490C|nr:DMT family transporter [Neobacillus sp. DY30]WHX98130.1 DMT family transporter [Neobacillus sp. DY30]